MKLYAISGGPPTLAVRLALKCLSIPHEQHDMDWYASEHTTDWYAELNPQKEVPVLDDGGFVLGESVAILQYLCDEHRPESPLYPKDAKARAIVNHRLCFNASYFYPSITKYSFTSTPTDVELKKVHSALGIFETYLKKLNSKNAAGDHLTIADFPLLASVLCLEAMNFSLDEYPLVKKWYETFKTENTELWDVAAVDLAVIAAYKQNMAQEAQSAEKTE